MKPMTAQEAMKLSKTGFVWTTDNQPAYWNGRDVFYTSGAYMSNWTEQDFYPDPPHLREREEAPTDWKHQFQCSEYRARLVEIQLESANRTCAKLQAELIDKHKPTTLKNCESEPPERYHAVLLFYHDMICGIGCYSEVTDWTFEFHHSIKGKIEDYYWCEIPEVRLPEDKQ